MLPDLNRELSRLRTAVDDACRVNDLRSGVGCIDPKLPEYKEFTNQLMAHVSSVLNIAEHLRQSANSLAKSENVDGVGFQQ